MYISLLLLMLKGHDATDQTALSEPHPVSNDSESVPVEIGIDQPDALAGVLPQHRLPAVPSENLDVHNENGAANKSQNSQS